MISRKNFRDSLKTMASTDDPSTIPEPPRQVLGVLPGWLLPVGVALIAAVLILAAVMGLQPHGPDPATRQLRQQVSELEQAMAATPTERPCVTATNYLDIITGHESAAEWDAAFTTAQTALRMPKLCAADKEALARKAVADGLAAIWATPSTTPADYDAQEAAVSRYQTLQRLSRSYGVTFPLSDRQVAGEAYKVSQFLLAKTVMEQGFETGQIDRTDQLQIGFYHDSVYNLGWWLANHASGEQNTLGLSLLATAAALDEQYQLGRGQAAEELRRLVSDDPGTWPKPAPSPLLSTGTDPALIPQGQSTGLR